MSDPVDFSAEAGDDQSFYAEVGGAPVFHRIAARFYEQVAQDAVLRPLYPEEDLGPAETRLRTYLEQHWGGPRTYSELRGHPRLRVRHGAFRIGPIERAAWMRCMRTAVDEAGLDEAHHARMMRYLQSAALGLVNSGY